MFWFIVLIEVMVVIWLISILIFFIRKIPSFSKERRAGMRIVKSEFDQKKLTEIACNHAVINVRLAALKKITDPNLLAEAKAEFELSTKGHKYVPVFDEKVII